MPDYRRIYVGGATVFLTIVTYHRRRLFTEQANIDRLRSALRDVRTHRPFDFVAAAILPYHLHLMWTLPHDDVGFPSRVGRFKAAFTRSLRAGGHRDNYRSPSRRRQREADVWQRRYFDHIIRNEDDFHHHFDYIHYNPVRHGYVRCPHEWKHSSFAHWVRAGWYDHNWGCGPTLSKTLTNRFGAIATLAE